MTPRLAAALCLLLWPPGAVADVAPVPRGGGESGAVVSRVSGEVVRFAAEPAFRQLVLAQDLLAGDLLRTGAQGAVGILFVDRTVLRLHPNSELLVKAVSADSAELTLQSGTLWARAPRGQADVVVFTPTAAAGIRGTDWSMSVEGDGTTRLSVYDGAVELANDLGAVLAQAGEDAVARPGQAPVKVGVANRREAPQMLYTLSPTDAADLLATVAEDVAGVGAEDPRALALYRQGLAETGRGAHAEAAASLERAADGLGRERAAAARWMAAYARLAAGGPFRAPPPSTADADAAGAAFAAALAGDLDRAQAALGSVSAPAARAAEVQLAILRDDGPGARRTLGALQRRHPGSIAALEAEAAVRGDLDGDAPAAVALLRQAVRRAPERASLWNALGLAEAAADHPREAEAAYRRALALEPAGAAQAGNLAILLLDQERVAEARAVAAGLLARDPQSYLGLRAMGRAALQMNDPAATGLLLQALAAQPAAAETSIALAIAAHQTGDATRAQQELDAAGRLDPNDATVPLIRSIVALDAGDADASIAAARRAAELMRGQDHGTRAVAADRNAGSPLANAYSAIGLEGWARYAADRSYDPLSPSSLFGEAFVQGPAIGRGGPAVQGSDRAAVQGLMLDPLAASYRLRTTDILRRPFFDTALGFDARVGGGADDRVVSLQLQGMSRVPVPLAYALSLGDVRSPAAGSPGPDTLRNATLLVGTQFRHGGAFALLGLSSDRDSRTQPVGFGLSARDTSDVESADVAVGGHYALGERGVLTLFASAARRRSDQTARRFAQTPATLLQLDFAVEAESRVETLSLGYRAEDATGVWAAGIDGWRTRERSSGSSLTTDLFTGATVLDVTDSDTLGHGARLYLDRRQRLSRDLQAEGLLTLDLAGAGGARAGGRLGLAWTPANGQWMRGAVLVDGSPAAATLAPATVLGLSPLGLPYAGDGRMRGLVLRYDVELGERLLFGVEHQSLRARNLSYGTSDPLTSLDIGSARLDATSATLDWWVGQGVGLRAGLTHAASRIGDGGFRGDPLPETPEWTATLGVGFLTRAQLSGYLNGVWTSERFSGGPDALPPVFTLDAGLEWQPIAKRASLRIDAVNLLDAEVTAPWGQPSSGREIRVSMVARF